MNSSYKKIAKCYRIVYKNVGATRLFSDFVPRYEPRTINPQNLPVLPIPKLEHTLRKLIQSAVPFATQCELETAQDVCQKFQRKEGPEIQNLLIQRAHETHNWLDEWYLKCSNLSCREALPMNSSSVVLFPTDKFRSKHDQIIYAAKLILGVLEFKKLVDGNKLPLETRERHPLDMGVYKNLFAYTRVPKNACDELVERQKDSHHIIVAFKNNFFKVMVMDKKSELLSFNQVMARLEDVIEYGCGKGEPFGILTSMRRDSWAKVHVDMKCLAENSQYFKDVENALFVVCLDETLPVHSYSLEGMRLNGCLNGFHGHGPSLNAANRWYDKTLQFFVDPEGSAGIICDHTTIDATPLANMADFLSSYVQSDKCMNIPFQNFCDKPELLTFVRNDSIKSAMNIGCKEAQEKSDTFSCQLLQYNKYGKVFCKDHSMDPDSLAQIAIQLAHLKLHGQFAPQQEIVSTRKFYLGRNDVIRSTTCEMVRFIRRIDDPLIFLQDRFDALRDAVRVHRDLSEDAMEGRAIDCHLFGLMMACRESGRHLPKVFQTRAYLKSSKFKIFSMQVPMENDCFMCYPPSCHGGYAVCYNPRSEEFNICVSCRRNDCDTNSKKFLEKWICGMDSLSDIISGYSRRKKKLRD